MSNYAIVETSGNISNVVIWDGETEWLPPEGTTAVLVPEGEIVDIGGTYIDGVFSRAVVEFPVAKPELSPAEQIAEMQAALASLMAKINQSE